MTTTTAPIEEVRKGAQFLTRTPEGESVLAEVIDVRHSAMQVLLAVTYGLHGRKMRGTMTLPKSGTLRLVTC